MASCSALPVRPPSNSTATQILINPSPMSERLGPVLHNDAGKRVDRVLDINLASSYLNFLRQNNLCYWYYLRGRCEGNCVKNHVAANPLHASAFDYLWYLARGGSCLRLSRGLDLCNNFRKGKVYRGQRRVHGHGFGHPNGSG